MFGVMLCVVGMLDFVDVVMEFVNDSIDVDVVYFECWCVDLVSMLGFVVEWLGSGSLCFVVDMLCVMDVYY